MHRIRPILFASFAIAGGMMFMTSARATDKSVDIGAQISNLHFKDIRYLPRSLDDFSGKKAFVIAFTNTTCPLVQRYLPTLKEMEKAYRDKGVQFLAVNVAADDTILAMAAHAVKFDVEFPFVKDFDGECVRSVGVQRTPGVAVLDGERRLRYRGRIDDQYRLGGTRENAGRNDLREALDEVLAGKSVSVPETPVDGCYITPAETKPANANVTFTEHVARIMQAHCQECHRPDTTAPFSLITYQQVAAKADEIVEVITEGRMPPWFAAEDYGHFNNKRSLTAAEKDTLIDWARTGKAKGDESKMPPPLKIAASGQWLIGKPDVVLQAPLHDLPASGDIAYKYVFLADPNDKSERPHPYVFKTDTWFKGIQILPDNRRTVHHCNMAFVVPGDKWKRENFITGTVPGGSPMWLDGNMGFLIPKGASLILQIHYVSTGKPEKCQISVGFRYASGMVQKRLRYMLLEDGKFAIPPGAPAYAVRDAKEVQVDADALALFVHMHLRGRDMTFRAHYPDGTTETLLMVPNYSFDWQIPYRWAQGEKRFPKGTRLEAVAHYDNSSFNPYNPNPKTTVKEGQQTRDEMMNGFVFYTASNEHLNLEIDPKTGIASAAKQ
jgi:thiol-disulfide isomerase/thioredoxin